MKLLTILTLFSFRGNCHPVVLEEMRKYYPKPHFLPDDCEIPSKEYVFMGYDDGATLHVRESYFIESILVKMKIYL